MMFRMIVYQLKGSRLESWLNQILAQQSQHLKVKQECLPLPLMAKPIKMAVKNVKIYACRKATKISSKLISVVAKIDAPATINVLNITIKPSRTASRICPARIFANNRIAYENSRTNELISSIKNINGIIGHGTFGDKVAKYFTKPFS